MSAVIPFEPGTIKDSVLCSVWALGEMATRPALLRAVVGNDAIVSIAIDGLVREGYMSLDSAGFYVLRDDVAAALNPGDRKNQPAVATPAAASPKPKPETETPEEIMAKTKPCKKCGDPKPADKAHFGEDSRTEDGLGKTCADCKHAAQSKPKRHDAPKPAKKGAKAEIANVADELVIPAAGEIHCRVLDAGAGRSFSFQQHDDQIVCSREQLRMVRDWADGQLKREAGH